MANLVLLAARRKADRFEAAGLDDRAKRAKKRVKELEVIEAAEAAPTEEDDLSEFHTGGGWYQIGDEKVQGKDAARELLEG